MTYLEKEKAVGHDLHDFELITDAGYTGAVTVSTGVFKWISRSGGKGLKRSGAIVRITGPVAKIDDVNSMAKTVMEQLNKDWWDGRKTVRVK